MTKNQDPRILLRQSLDEIFRNIGFANTVHVRSCEREIPIKSRLFNIGVIIRPGH
jgi:hypothetical protein